MDRLREYLEIYWLLVRMNWRATSGYRFDFIVGNFGTLMATIATILSFSLLFQRAEVIAGWTVAEWLLLIGLGSLSRALWDSFFVSMIELGEMVRTGLVDEVLTRPVHPLLLLLTRKLDPDTWAELALSASLLAYGLWSIDAAWSFAKALYLLLTILGGVGIYAGLHLIVNTLSFWLVDVSPFSAVLWRLDDFTSLPMSFYPGWLVSFFTWIVPLAFVNYYPALVLKGESVGLYAYLTPLVGLLLSAVAVGVWELGTRHYTSTGS